MISTENSIKTVTYDDVKAMRGFDRYFALECHKKWIQEQRKQDKKEYNRINGIYFRKKYVKMNLLVEKYHRLTHRLVFRIASILLPRKNKLKITYSNGILYELDLKQFM